MAFSSGYFLQSFLPARLLVQASLLPIGNTFCHGCSLRMDLEMDLPLLVYLTRKEMFSPNRRKNPRKLLPPKHRPSGVDSHFLIAPDSLAVLLRVISAMPATGLHAKCPAAICQTCRQGLCRWPWINPGERWALICSHPFLQQGIVRDPRSWRALSWQ